MPCLFFSLMQSRTRHCYFDSYVLLARPSLKTPLPVQPACVKYPASVLPEPGRTLHEIHSCITCCCFFMAFESDSKRKTIFILWVIFCCGVCLVLKIKASYSEILLYNSSSRQLGSLFGLPRAFSRTGINIRGLPSTHCSKPMNQFGGILHSC